MELLFDMEEDLEKINSNLDPIRVKIELLCWGIAPNQLLEKAFLLQNPHLDKRTGNGGLQLILPADIIANVPVFHKFGSFSPYLLIEKNGQLLLQRNGKNITPCSLVKPPHWYTNKTKDGIEMAKILVQEERDKLIGNVISYCEYFKNEGECKFCAISPYGGLREKTPEEIKDVIVEAKKENPNVSLQLTGGSLIRRDSGGIVYAKVASFIRKYSSVPICLEATPPLNNKSLDDWLDAGINSFSINLEIWDKKLRRLFCPTKSRITSERYFETWEYLQNELGYNTIDSVLIGGLENKSSVLKGAKEMIKRNVWPTIIPFKPNDMSYIQNFVRTSPDFIENISKEVGRMLVDSPLNYHGCAGCHGCEGCSVERNYYDKYIK